MLSNWSWFVVNKFVILNNSFLSLAVSVFLVSISSNASPCSMVILGWFKLKFVDFSVISSFCISVRFFPAYTKTIDFLLASTWLFNKKFPSKLLTLEIYLSAFSINFSFCISWRSEEGRVGKECGSRWSPYH